MSQDSLSAAIRLMKRRKFGKAIVLLESREDYYTDNFDYYLQLGICYLYTGNYGSASQNFQKARRIKMTDVNLLLGQAVLFLRRGDTDRAIQYYIEILESDPQNKIASSAMEFIRKDGDYSTICRLVDTGKIEQFFPPLGMSFYKVSGVVIPVIAALLGVLFAVKFFAGKQNYERSISYGVDVTQTLSDEEKRYPLDREGGEVLYTMKMDEVVECYERVCDYFNEENDNRACVEVNRILLSNASDSIKQKAKLLKSYFEEPEFDGIKNNFSCREVLKEPQLYSDCWVQWGGVASNIVTPSEAIPFQCDFFVSDEDMKEIEGNVILRFPEPKTIVPGKYLKVLAKISVINGKIYLEGRSFYQTLKDNLITTEKK